VRRKRLLTVFGSVNAIKRASVDEIAAVKGMTSGARVDGQVATQRVTAGPFGIVFDAENA
jgi:ERCC4-type nuclease